MREIWSGIRKGKRQKVQLGEGYGLSSCIWRILSWNVDLATSNSDNSTLNVTVYMGWSQIKLGREMAEEIFPA